MAVLQLCLLVDQGAMVLSPVLGSCRYTCSRKCVLRSIKCGRSHLRSLLRFQHFHTPSCRKIPSMFLLRTSQVRYGPLRMQPSFIMWLALRTPGPVTALLPNIACRMPFKEDLQEIFKCLHAQTSPIHLAAIETGTKLHVCCKASRLFKQNTMADRAFRLENEVDKIICRLRTGLRSEAEQSQQTLNKTFTA
eukprot:356816-Chlamydomonas_euryale.AAC.2